MRCRSRRIRLADCILLAFLLWAPLVRGDITYTLQFDPASSSQAQQVANSVAVAAAFYNQNGSFNKHWNVYYNPGILTAEAGYNGYMGYGGSRNERVVFHEASHTFGMGTTTAYSNLISGGVWKGQYGNRAQAETYNDYADGLHGDGHAIWPGGFNYDNEDGFLQRYWHTRIMAGIRADMGILSFTRETRNEAVVVGETAEFRVESPVATSWQWYKNGLALTNGGDISGANSATLRIANVEASDAGTYLCAATGAGETLNCRPRQLWVHAAPQLGQWNFDGNPNDSIGTNNGTAIGSPAYVTGRIGQAVDLDGSDDYIDLPDNLGRLRDLTIATWVNWDGGGNWQRIFDFGTGTNQYLFLSPRSGSGTLRLAFKDAINGRNAEYIVDTTVLPTAQWVHLAAVIKGNYMTLYVNGKPVGSAFEMTGSPADFPAVNNYIGKSQFADPLFNGRIDDFRIHGRALDGSEIWSLWGQSANHAPVFSTDVISLPTANALNGYTGQSLAPFASDPNSEPLSFAKIHGPAWLTVAPDGTLSGQPGPGDSGPNTFIVRVTDPAGATSDATLELEVYAPLVPVTASSTAPSPDANDASYLPGSVNEPNTIDGTGASGNNDESTYVSPDRSSKGQTFTTGSHPSGYFLHSFAFQHVGWSTFTENGTYYDIQPGDQWTFQVGTMAGTAKTPVLTYIATYDGTALTGSGTSGSGQFLTFNISGLGLHLDPNTTYYFEIAPLTGNPGFELNSAKAGTYAGGTAFRGNSGTDDGTIASGVNLLAGDFAFHARLEEQKSTSSTTVAYWNFEEGAANTYVPYSRTTSGQYDGSIPDLSGNGNHLSAWAANWHWYRTQVPGATTPRNGFANTRSVQNANNFPAISAIGTSLTNWSPTAWTIEAAVRPNDATNGYQTIVGRDSRGAFEGNAALAALYLSLTPSGALRIMFTDAAGNNWDLTSSANALQDAKWFAVAATSDGQTLSLYRRNLTDNESEYTLLGTLDISSSANPAISTGAGDGENWDAGVFSFGRGLYDGGHTDRFIGYLDDVRLSDAALAPSAFLYSPPPNLPAAPTGISATTVSKNEISVTWAVVSGATNYTVKRSTSSGGPYTPIASPNGTNFSDSNLSVGTTYHYVVSATNTDGEGSASTQATATTWTLAQAWRKLHFNTIDNIGDAHDDADPDNDLASNLAERAFGGNPKVHENDLLPAIDGTGAFLSIVYRRALDATDLSIVIEESTDLKPPWKPAAGTATVLGTEGNVQRLRFTRPVTTEPCLFLRARVTGQ